MAEPDFVLSIDEKKQFEAYCIQRALNLHRNGMSLDSAGKAVLEFADKWLADWRHEQTKKGPRYRVGSIAKRSFDSEAAQEVIPAPPPTYGPEEFGPDQLENEQAIVGNLLGFLIHILGQIIDVDFSPASVIKGARDSIQSLRAITRGQTSNEYGILTQAIKQATRSAPFGWRQSDLDRAGAMLTEFIRIQLGAKDEAPRDLSGKSFVELVAGHAALTDNVFARHRDTPKVPAESGSLAERTIGPPRYQRLNNAWIKNGPRGKRGVVGIREAVRNTLGIKTPAGYHEREIYSNRPA